MTTSKIKSILALGSLICSLAFFSACELVGLDLQQNYDYEASAPDPNINMSAWEYLNQERPDTLFKLMLEGIKYAGLEEEYSKPDRTFIFLTNAAIYQISTTGVELSTSYFVRNKVNGESAKSWQDYPVEQVRDLFLYHILQGVHTYPDITLENTTCETLLNEQTVTIKMLTINDSRLAFNNYEGTIRAVNARTSNIRPTNGVIHVIDQNLYYE